MILKKCAFDELPDEMQMHVLYGEKVKISEYRLAIWSNKNTLYYNDLKKSEVKRFVALIESDKEYLHHNSVNSIYKKYGLAVYMEIENAHMQLSRRKSKSRA